MVGTFASYLTILIQFELADSHTPSAVSNTTTI